MISISKMKLYNFLKSKGVNYLYHANTVTTACTFIEQGGLLSRGFVERNGLLQTSQNSDVCDKNFGVWDYIFVDVCDLHDYFKRQNLYGPICFRLNAELLLDDTLTDIGITKDNPIYWEDWMSESDRYYESVNSYIEKYESYFQNKEIQSKMIVIDGVNNIVPFDKYLDAIIIDYTQSENKEYYDHAVCKIRKALEDNGFSDGLIKLRLCTQNCFCDSNYSDMTPNELYKLFG